MSDQTINRQTLLELRDTQFPLLKKLRQKAPGTYIHSLLVSELSTTAALHFKHCDPLLTQVGGMFHDIGKMVHPEAYAENQEDGEYPFLPEVIITHVEKSIELGKSFHLPECVIRFMITHHGTQNAPSLNPEQKNPYPCSLRPHTIEETLIMLADSCEAAVRGNTDFSRESVKHTIKKVFSSKIKKEQLRESVLIHSDLHQVEEDFADVFLAVYHRRFATEN